MVRTRFYNAEGYIKTFFKTSTKKVYSIQQLNLVFDKYRDAWKLPVSMNSNKFIERLIKREILKKKILEFDGYLQDKEIYLCDDANIFEMALVLINKSYLSHYTAAYLNGLTTQIPKIVYLSFEQGNKLGRDHYLEQKAIDNAFSKPQKMSNTKTIIDDYAILIHNGMNTNRAGVYSNDEYSLTNIERTLIDIAVRPSYAGGVLSVLDIYKNAVEKVSINKLVAILNNIDFIYPYHQAIGFYLERAGIESKKLDQLRKKKMEFDFYLAYDMQEKEYSQNWKIYYPKGM